MIVENNKVAMTLSEMLTMFSDFDGKRPPRPCNQCMHYFNGKCNIRKGCANRIKE